MQSVTTEKHTEPVPVSVPLTLADFDVPDDPEQRFTPVTLARIIGGSVRAWQRACERGLIRAVQLPGGGWVIPYIELVYYVMRSQNVTLN